MPKEARPAPFLVGETPALDFLNTVATPRSIRFDWLDTGPSLLDWLVAAGLATEAELRPLRTGGMQKELERTRREIAALRETLRGFVERASGAEMADAGEPIIPVLNGILATGHHHFRIEVADEAAAGRQGSFRLTAHQPLVRPADLIVRIALAASRLVAEADFRHVRKCEAPACTLYFLDVSRNHRRRWCSMEVCGNRAKAAAFRKR
ncbi:CGNR zinc finger domain-containing protein [Mangrovicoccus sp. HB161399]|uniref:CGNR zinc finger domain-containing protein n=1 Tax=Mangrovicoccus sp. HB161399 TaxID=2720392 RepID=UPI001556B5A4|nr:CGNR zinc finger domain-containing protein [Mangrovicoccus sp. HB161399]